MRARPSGDCGFTFVEIMIVVALIGLLAAIAVPSWHRALQNSQLHSIANNLRMLESAKAQYALEHRLATSQTIALSDLAPYLRAGQLPKPVAEETYSIGGGSTVADLVQADFSGTLAGKTAPLTITSFD